MRQDFSLMKELSVYTRVGPNERYQQLNGFLNDIKGRAEGMHVDSPQMIELPNDRSEAFIHIIGNSASPRVDLVCCILTNNRKDCYDAIKKVLCIDCPIPSQAKKLLVVGIDTYRDSQSRSSQMVDISSSKWCFTRKDYYLSR
ncbi:unnamed protein product [Rotaria magnacalcarata]|uniref:Uncharacterized protein n=1 Tax=Rotaria magnacalcarata TaxID=392030 RepID=A0A816WIP1_9BILA|nr:unnamed protein product [Rotaria magnacalcarata]